MYKPTSDKVRIKAAKLLMWWDTYKAKGYDIDQHVTMLAGAFAMWLHYYKVQKFTGDDDHEEIGYNIAKYDLEKIGLPTKWEPLDWWALYMVISHYEFTAVCGFGTMVWQGMASINVDVPEINEKLELNIFA